MPGAVRRLNILFLGPPGVGKGTFGALLSKKWGLPHISTGDMIRAEIKGGTELGRKFKSFSDSGGLVPDSLVCDIAESRLRQADAKRGHILDGFPRTPAQAAWLEKFQKTSLCLNYTMPDSLLVQKLAGRRVCIKCGANYNVAHISEGVYQMKPLLPRPDGSCHECGSKEISQRSDDRVEVVEKRVALFHDETAPLIDYYCRQGVLRTFGVTKGLEDYPALERMAEISMQEIDYLRNQDADFYGKK